MMMQTSIKLAPGEKLLELRLDAIRIDGNTQSRAGINPETVSEYMEHLEELPPVVVFFDGSHYWLSDGFHRYHAHREKKRKSITAVVKTGTVRNAILYSTGSNADHGLRRTRDDNRHICRMLLTDPEWSRWSDRQIAEQGKVGRWLVGEVRKELKEEELERQEREKERIRLEEEKKRQEEETRAKAERDKLKEGWVAPGKKPEPKPEPEQQKAAGENEKTSLAGSTSQQQEESRTYRTKHGTVSQIKVGAIQESNKRLDRKSIRVETDKEEIEEIWKKYRRSVPKAVRQAKQLGLTWEQHIQNEREMWDAMPVAEG